MLELTEYIHTQMEKKPYRTDISLSGMLEAFIGNYYVSGEGSDDDFHWLTIYYDPSIDAYTEAVETIPSNIVAYVSSDYRWAFVLTSHIHEFRKDTLNYGISYISVKSFSCGLLQCAHIDLLPCEFSNILWIDDDFLNDENIPFDFSSFALIDDGVHYINPKHFSVVQLITIMERNLFAGR